MATTATGGQPASYLEPVGTICQEPDQRRTSAHEPGQPGSLTSDSSGNSSLPPTPISQMSDDDDVYQSNGHQDQKQSPGENQKEDHSDTEESPIKCSAVHTLERDMPDFDISHLVAELKRLILDDIERNPGLYSESDIDKCRNDPWHVERFLLRNKLQISDAFDMMRRAMRFNHESLASCLRPVDFPAEFYLLGGIFTYEPDRKGNKMLYLRVALHRKTPEINAVVQAFIYYNIRRADDEAKGKGLSIVIDCTGGGLANADMELLLFIVSSLKNYFPKGLSYFLVHGLPWILKPFWHIAKTWIPDEYRQLIKFSDPGTIREYVAEENLPDFMGGTCKRTYRQPPDNCTTIEEASKLWGVDHRTMRKVFAKFQEHLPVESVERVAKYLDECEQAERD